MAGDAYFAAGLVCWSDHTPGRTGGGILVNLSLFRW
jgi:hypothetical protein